MNQEPTLQVKTTPGHVKLKIPAIILYNVSCQTVLTAGCFPAVCLSCLALRDGRRGPLWLPQMGELLWEKLQDILKFIRGFCMQLTSKYVTAMPQGFRLPSPRCCLGTREARLDHRALDCHKKSRKTYVDSLN